MIWEPGGVENDPDYLYGDFINAPGSPTGGVVTPPPRQVEETAGGLGATEGQVADAATV